MTNFHRSESPLLKLRQAWKNVLDDNPENGMPFEEREANFKASLTEAEERWNAERELHKQQVVKIRKQRHDFIQALRWNLARAQWIAEQYRDMLPVLAPEKVRYAGHLPWEFPWKNEGTCHAGFTHEITHYEDRVEWDCNHPVSA